MTQAVALAQQASTGVSQGFKNRIINGAMTIDQRNAGAAQNSLGGSASIYLVDRWQYYGVVASKFNSQQNAGSVTPPAGFSNYLGLTSTSAYSVASTDFFQVAQNIEGFNTSDLGWGTANAKTVTLSFWVYSSLTGTFGGTLNGAQYYPFTYSIPTANTWTQISVTVAGSTLGSWGTGNSTSIGVVFSLGAGSSVIGTAGTWSNTVYRGATGQVNVVGTNGATFYITGVQLEVGSTATSFDYLDYGRSLIQCQRYYAKMNSLSGNFVGFGSGVDVSSTGALVVINYPTTMRAAPTLAVSNVRISDGTTDATVTSLTTTLYGSDSLLTQVAVASGLSASRGCVLLGNNNAAAYVELSSEL